MAAFNKERTAKLIDPKWLGKDFNPSDEEQLTTQRLNTYLVDCIDSYMEGEFLDDILFLNLKDDFPDWTEEHFKLTDKTLRSNFKNYLKDHGIYIGNNGSVSAEITLALRQNKCPEWPEEEAERYRQFRKEKFQSYRNNPGFDKPDCNSPTPTKKVPNTTTKASKVKKIDKGKKVAENPNPDDDDSSDSSSDDGSHDRRSDGDNDGGGDPSDGGQESPIKEISRSFKNASITPAPAFRTTTSKALTDLGKLYDNNKKFGGDLYDILDSKIKIFRDLCNKAGVPPHLYHEAYSTMLKDRAEQFYYDHLAERDLQFEEMVTRTKEFFHTVENRQLYLQEWRSTTLLRVIQGNPDKDLSQCLEVVVDKLQKVHKGLSSNYHADYNLAEQLVNACQGVEACALVLMKPVTTFESVASDLRSAIGIYMRCKQEVPRQHNTEPEQENGQYWVDRRYTGGRDRQGRGGFRGGFTGDHSSRGRYERGRGGGNDGNNTKKCFVCGKRGCWSTKHPISERKPRQNQWRRYMQEHERQDDFATFLIDYEGVDTGGFEDEAGDFDSWCTATQGTETSQSENFFTGYGPVNGESTVMILNNQAALHTITQIDMFDEQYTNQEQQPAQLFHFRSRYDSAIFQGIMPDTGAAGVSTAGKNQVQALQKVMDIEVDTSTAGQHRVRFGDNPENASLGTVGVETPFGTINFQVVPTDTPFLFCLSDMDKHQVYLNNLRNVLVHKGKEYPVVRKWGHPWLLLKEPEKTLAWCHLTETELRQLHRRFGHPAAERLYKVLSRAGHEDLDYNTLARIVKFCHQCQMHGGAPGRFRFTLRDDIDFNYRVLVDVMYLNGKPVVHVIDEATAFQAARFLHNVTAKATWDAIRAMWIDTYVGPPDIIVSDSGTNFTAAEFCNNARIMAIDVHEVPVEAHNSIGKLERYHGPLRRAYEVITADLRATGTTAADALQMAVKAVNDTAGPDGLVPTLLVFGTYPRMTDSSPPSPSIEVRANAVRKAMAEVRKLKAKRQVDGALATRNGPNTIETLNLPLQSEVKVWREHRGWTGPHTLLSRNSEKCTVDINGSPTDFRIVVVRPYYRDETTSAPDPDDNSTTPDNDDGDGEWIPQEDIPAPNEPKKGGKKRGRPPGSKNKPKPAAPKISSIDAAIANGMNLSMAYLTAKEKSDYALSLQLRKEGKITTAGEPFELSDQKEVDGLISRGVFEFTQYNPEKHDGIRIFKSRMVREVKGKTTDTPYEKSRLVIQGHSDQDKELVLTQSPTIQRASQRVIVALAPSLLQIEGMQLWLRDITQAYIQSTTVLQRKILAHLPKEIQHLYPPDTIMAVIKPLYGIAEAGTHWWATYFKHHRERLNMVTSTYDPCLLITSPSSTHFGIVGMQTDDTLGLSDENFAALEDEQLKEAKFLAKPRETLSRGTPLLFNGCVLSVQNDTLLLQQKKQGDKLKVITNAQEYVEQRARGAYMATVCQPEASFDLSAAAQHKSPEKEDIARLNKRIKWQMENIDRGLAYIPLNLHTAKLFVYVDGSFANNKDLSSQIGFVIFLANETTGEGSFTMTGNLIYWSSTKCKRITRSVLASEIYAMAHGVDTAIAVNTTIDMVLNKLSSIGGIPASLPLIVCTDSLSLYECLVKLGTTKEKRLMIDVMGLRQAYERHEIAEIRWIHGSDNPADAMTKGDPNRALQTFVDTNTITMRVQGQVTRNQVLKSD